MLVGVHLRNYLKMPLETFWHHLAKARLKAQSPEIPRLGARPRNPYVHTQQSTHREKVCEVLFIIAPNCQQSIRLSPRERINKPRSIYTVKDHIAMKTYKLIMLQSSMGGKKEG